MTDNRPSGQNAEASPASPPSEAVVGLPAWLRELQTAVVTNPQILIYGNVRDTYMISGPDGDTRFLGLRDAVAWALSLVGFSVLLTADVVDGHGFVGDSQEFATIAANLPKDAQVGDACTLGSLTGLLRAVVQPPRPDAFGRTAATAPPRVAVFIDYAARLVLSLPQLTGDEHRLFATAEKLSHMARPVVWPDGVRRYNPIIWIVNHERELPTWLIAGNDGIRRITVPMPELDDRLGAAALLAPGLPAPVQEATASPAAQVTRFAESTHGLTLRSMSEIVRLARSGHRDVSDIEAAARCYRVGILDNPWSKPALRQRLRGAADVLRHRVRGQDQAIQHSVDIIVRSVMGLSGAQAGSVVSRPRGVLFFAGPTGVGKTELAKALTELIFGDESAYLRFDMSEFAAPHAAERLVGAPPGYLGHDAGGELTNAIRERPFSLVLFDEIEKAHPDILDKFLQILDDGRLTDGSGSTTYFSEAVIVFTSNLGMKVRDESGQLRDNVTDDLDRSELELRLKAAVRLHFTDTLNRPELLNRIGDNVVVFNFIKQQAASQIFDAQLDRVCDRVARQHRQTVVVAPNVREQLRELAVADLGFGGRGIGSLLETAFVNPLARALFERTERRQNGSDRLTVIRIERVDGTWQLEFAAGD